MDNNNSVLIDFASVFMLYTLIPIGSVGLDDCISIVISVFKKSTHLTTFEVRCVWSKIGQFSLKLHPGTQQVSG